MRPSNENDLAIRNLALIVLNEKGVDSGNIRSFEDRSISITRFPAKNGGKGITINYRGPGAKPISVFVLVWGGRKTGGAMTLCHVGGSWDVMLRRLAMDCAPNARLQTA